MISTALLVIAAARASTKLTLFGTELAGPFIGPAAILYFSVCTAAYTNFELKMRVYRAFFKSRLDGLRGPLRAEMLMRYPLVFAGSEFLPTESRPMGWTLSWQQIIQSIPAIIAMTFGWLVAVFGLMALLGYSFYAMCLEPSLPAIIKWSVGVALGGAMIFSAKMLRGVRVRHLYVKTAA